MSSWKWRLSCDRFETNAKIQNSKSFEFFFSFYFCLRFDSALGNLISHYSPYLKEPLIDWRNSVNSKEIPENENTNKVTDNVLTIKKIPSQKKCLGVTNHLKIVTPKQILQRLLITQVKAGNTSENLLNEIREIIYALYPAKEITKKVYSIIINSINL